MIVGHFNNRNILLLICYLLVFPSVAGAESALSRQELNEILEKHTASIDNRVNSAIDRRLDTYKSLLTQEAKEHREYIESLDDKFYKHISFWLPIAIGFFSLILLVFSWWLGKTKKELMQDLTGEIKEKAELEVKKLITRADRCLEEQIDQLIDPEYIENKLLKINEDLEKYIATQKQNAENLARDTLEVSLENDKVQSNAAIPNEAELIDRINNLEHNVNELSHISTELQQVKTLFSTLRQNVDQKLNNNDLRRDLTGLLKVVRNT